MMITDAQIHIWGPNTPEHPWSRVGGSVAKRGGEPFGTSDILAELDQASVARAVLVPPSWTGTNYYALQAASDYPDRLGVMGIFDVAHSGVRDVQTWLEQPGMLGVRLNIRRSEFKEKIADDGIDWFFSAAETFGVPIMALAPGQAAAISEIARRHPALRIIIDHLNLSAGVHADNLGAALEELWPLSKHPNIAVKISALPIFVDESFPFPSLHQHIQRAVETFGAERCMWGSDLTRLTCPYSDWVRTITEGVDFLSPEQREQIMGGTASAWLNWPTPAE
jgi:L-fuconolactonase